MIRPAIALVIGAGIGLAQQAAQRAPAAKPAARPAAAAPKSYKDLKYPPLKEIRLPDIVSFTLANGMRVFLLENHELPLVRGSARIRTGNVYEPAEKVGLSDVFGEVLRTGGTKTRTGDQINELLEGIAASIESDVGETSATLSFNTLSEHTTAVLELFKEILVEPEFRQDKIDVAKNQLRSVIARRNDQPSSIASREFNRLLYGPQTPWGRQMEYETLERITRDDLIAFHRRYYFPKNILLAIHGDFSPAAMRGELEKLFADWQAQQEPVGPLPAVTHRAQPGVYLAEKNDVNQTFFRIGHLGGLLSDADYPALEVMADILGGSGFTSRLVKKVRSELGYAYNVGASWAAEYDHPGVFLIAGSTKSASTVETIRVIRQEVERIRSEEVSDEELRIAKESTLNSFVFNFASAGQILGRLVAYEYYGYPKDFIFRYQKAIAAVTKADVLRVAKTYLKPDTFVVLAVGKPSDFGTPLEALNLPVRRVDLSIPEPKREAAVATDESLARGRQLLGRLQQAVGGAEKLAAVKDYAHLAEVSVLSMPGGLKVKQHTRVLPPQIRIDQQLPFGNMTVYYDGKGGGWFHGPQGGAPIPPQAMKQAQEELFRLLPTLWLSDRNPERTVNAVGPLAVEISDKQGNWIRLNLDETSGLPRSATYRAADMSGPAEAEAVYEDWKEVAGLKLPHKIKIAQRGKPAAEITVTEYRLNTGLTTETLSARP